MAIDFTKRFFFSPLTDGGAKFLDENFLLQNKTAERLYHEHAASMPIIDYHNHLPPVQLTNGFQFKGMIKGFDGFTVILDCEGKQYLVYKHAISTIIPAKQISILDSEQMI